MTMRKDKDPPRKQPTLKTIATKLGLGVTTVSRALKDGPELSLETRRSVQQTARELGYRINRAGLRLRTGKTNIISLVLDTEEQIGSFVSEMIFGITEGLTGTPYHLIVTPYSRLADALEPIRYLVETGSVDGIIISRIEPDDERVHYMIEHDMPFVTHGRTAGLQHAYQDFDNEAFARIGVERLAELGRKRIALLAPPAGLAFFNHMRQGFLKGLADHGLQEVPFDFVTNDDSMEEIGRAIRDLLRQPVSPDGIVSGAGGASGTGGSTFALIAGLEEAGLVLGRDIDIVAKQLFTSLPLFRKQIHVVHEDVRDTGRALAKALIGAIDGKPISELQNLVVPTQVISPAPYPFWVFDPGI
ncbi:LacI family transcriptional regulator [Phyllobacterium myrsinacearum]|uniref:LacI family transcriptional regulator n=1 Tax=Phyllobacterium myrsinacearum TaxID=28101 RepID=UPI00102943C3|nr:LacI family transcriptional regulator [Phyllobacterium myrsinacearum]RZS76839.1 LacI family transcriptional regulator [Phyllobacterium myrsinacearum]